MQSGDNPPIFDLIFERIEDTSLLSSFICGIKKLDDFIHHGLQTYIETIPCETYLVFMERKLVALLTLKEDQLILDDDDKDDMRQGFSSKPKIAIDEPSYLTDSVFPSVEIAYLAVEESYRRQGIGRYIVEEVVRKVRQEHPDYQFVTVDAYVEEEYSAVEFYLKCHFEPAEPTPGFKDTLRMYRVLVPVHRSDV